MINATVVGRVGADAELRDISGDKVCGFSVASSRGKDKDPVWVRCSYWGKRGEKVRPYVKKGGWVAVSGELDTSEKDGRVFLNLRVDRLELLGDKPKDGERRESRNEEGGADDIPF